jgi:hemerythrin-like domain-containing protein
MTLHVTGRRGLLVAGAGIAGVALGRVAEGAWPHHDEGDDAVPRPPSPGEELMTEHGVLKRVLLAYRAASTRIATGQQLPADAVIDAAQIVGDYVEGFHEGLEEAYVFPRVASHAPYGDLVETLLVQHDRGRHLTAEILQLASRDLTAPQERSALQQRLDAFVTMYEPHEAWEDTVIYPALRAVTPQTTLDELAERFADLESGRYSDLALATILGRVTGVEEQLGIHDLATFTPPARLTDQTT